jgi:hypothetical protein
MNTLWGPLPVAFEPAGLDAVHVPPPAGGAAWPPVAAPSMPPLPAAATAPPAPAALGALAPAPELGAPDPAAALTGEPAAPVGLLATVPATPPARLPAAPGVPPWPPVKVGPVVVPVAAELPALAPGVCGSLPQAKAISAPTIVTAHNAARLIALRSSIDTPFSAPSRELDKLPHRLFTGAGAFFEGSGLLAHEPRVRSCATARLQRALFVAHAAHEPRAADDDPRRARVLIAEADRRPEEDALQRIT